MKAFSISWSEGTGKKATRKHRIFIADKFELAIKAFRITYPKGEITYVSIESGDYDVMMVGG